MHRELRFKPSANEQYERIKSDPASKSILKQVRKTLGYLEKNLRAKSLQTHKYESLTRRYRIPVFEAYVQQDTPAAYRVFWHYGPDETDRSGKRIPIITIVAITPHP
jgi:hypothetical protein